MPNNAPFFNFQNRVKFTGGAELKSQAKKKGAKAPFFLIYDSFFYFKIRIQPNHPDCHLSFAKQRSHRLPIDRPHRIYY